MSEKNAFAPPPTEQIRRHSGTKTEISLPTAPESVGGIVHGLG